MKGTKRTRRLLSEAEADIEITKKRMFRLLAEELLSLARIQFIITLVIFLLCMIFLPQVGFGEHDASDLSLPCSGIFHFVFDVCGDYFSVLFR